VFPCVHKYTHNIFSILVITTCHNGLFYLCVCPSDYWQKLCIKFSQFFVVGQRNHKLDFGDCPNHSLLAVILHQPVICGIAILHFIQYCSANGFCKRKRHLVTISRCLCSLTASNRYNVAKKDIKKSSYNECHQLTVLTKNIVIKYEKDDQSNKNNK